MSLILLPRDLKPFGPKAQRGGRSRPSTGGARRVPAPPKDGRDQLLKSALRAGDLL